MYNNLNRGGITMKNLVPASIFTFFCVSLLLYVLINFSSEAPAAEVIPVVSANEPMSTLTCMGPEGKAALEKIREAYSIGGDEAAYAESNKYSRNTYGNVLVYEDQQEAIQNNSPVCFYNQNPGGWWDPAAVPQGFEQYTDVPCEKLDNGHCLSVQPIIPPNYNKENDVLYMLVEPLTETGTAPNETVAGRLELGLIFNMNF